MYSRSTPFSNSNEFNEKASSEMKIKDGNFFKTPERQFSNENLGNRIENAPKEMQHLFDDSYSKIFLQNNKNFNDYLETQKTENLYALNEEIIKEIQEEKDSIPGKLQ